MESSSSSGSSSKRAKGFDSVRHAVSCSVDGCNSDLSQCREYHRRHKVCELHSKTPMVTIAGREQRFCQQCSRFHSLVEFDDEKRSCRKRLDGHNRRRRKPQSDPLLKSPGSFLSSQQGGTLLSFSTTPQLLSSAIPDSSWAGPIKLEADAGPYYCHDNAVGSLAHSLGGGGNQFKIISGGNYPNPGPLFTKPVVGPGNSNELGPRVVDSDCALSLLSSAMAENRAIGLSHSSVHDMQYCGNLGQIPPGGIDSKPVAYNASNLPCQGLFQNGLDWPSSSGPDSARSFKWE